MVRRLSELTLEEIRCLDATTLVRASLLDQQERGGPEVRHSEPLATVRAKSAPASGMSRNREIAETIASSPTYHRDIAIIEACMSASGQLLGEVAKEFDQKFAAQTAEIASLKVEVAALQLVRRCLGGADEDASQSRPN